MEGGLARDRTKDGTRETDRDFQTIFKPNKSKVKYVFIVICNVDVSPCRI